jgi:hypothetical protein
MQTNIQYSIQFIKEHIILILYGISILLLIVGLASQPILSIETQIKIPLEESTKFYITYAQTLAKKTDYASMASNSFTMKMQVVLAFFIITIFILTAGIVLSIMNYEFYSKITFIAGFVFLTVLYLVIQFGLVIDPVISNSVYSNLVYDNGYILMTTAFGIIFSIMMYNLLR